MLKVHLGFHACNVIKPSHPCKPMLIFTNIKMTTDWSLSILLIALYKQKDSTHVMQLAV